MEVLDTLETKATSALAAIFREFDHRFVHFKVAIKPQGKELVATGAVHYPQLEEAALALLNNAIPDLPIRSQLKVLTRDYPLRFAVVTTPSAMGVFRPGAPPKEATTELLAGQVVRTFMKQAEWIFCQAPDGYLGWLQRKDLRSVNTDYYLKWSRGPRWRLINPWTSDCGSEYRIGSEFILNAKGRVCLPNREILNNTPCGEIVDPACNPLRPKVIDIARSYTGVPYLWGGRTEQGVDCSGFMQMIYARIGIALPRDANQQANMGLHVGHLPDFSDLLPGDLLFFMNPKNAKIFHVGISLGANAFIHSESKRGVTEAHFKSHSDQAGGHPYSSSFCFARRVLI